MYHKPVLIDQSIDGLKINPNGIYVDATFGGGGHSREILTHLNEGRLFAFDRDPDSESNMIDDRKFKMLTTNYKNMRRFLRLEGVQKVDGVIADLGISSHQINIPDRGFSFRFDAALDMRMDQTSKVNAKEVLNGYSEKELSRVFYNYGEIKNSHKLSAEIVKAREEKDLSTTFDLLDVVEGFASKSKKNQFFSKVFQAIRIEVNNEIESLRIMLEDTINLLNPGGRLVVISYHSLEDRMVKNLFKKGDINGEVIKDIFGNITNKKFKQIHKKVIVPDNIEKHENNRSRSAKLRIGERI